MKKQLTILFVFLLNTSGFLFAQSPFSKLYSGGYPFGGYSILEAPDSGYIISGEQDYNGFIMKTDNSGNLIWNKQINYTQIVLTNMAATSDSCFVVTGPIPSYAGYYCIKMNYSGDTLWSKTYNPGGVYQQVFSISETSDHGFILCGRNVDNASSGHGYFYFATVLKINSAGNCQWANSYTLGNSWALNNGTNIAYSVKQTADGGYIVLGNSENYTSGTYTSYATLTKFSSTGTLSWTKKYRPTSGLESVGFDVFVKNDGYLCYVAVNGNSELMKTDLAGNVTWTKSYVGNYVGNYGGPYALTYPKMNLTSDGGYIFTNANHDLTKIDSVGNVIWADKINQTNAYAIETKTHGYILLGHTGSSISLITLDSSGNAPQCVIPTSTSVTPAVLVASAVSPVTISPWANTHLIPLSLIPPTTVSFFTGCPSLTGIEDLNSAQNDISVSPNPFNDQAVLSFTEPQKNCTIVLYDILGKEVYNSGTLPEMKEIVIRKENLKEGIYILQAKTGNGMLSKKIIIQ